MTLSTTREIPPNKNHTKENMKKKEVYKMKGKITLHTKEKPDLYLWVICVRLSCGISSWFDSYWRKIIALVLTKCSS